MNTRTQLSIVTFAAFLNIACNSVPGNLHQSNSKPISHEIWDELLRKHVSENGNVNYKGFISDSISFNRYLNLLSANVPNDESWSENEQKAFWINSYNAFTVKLIIMHYPLKSIKDIGSSIQLPFVNTPWDIKFINMDGEKYDLNNIEHGILRKKFNDPRIHFAINCASNSCPKLLNKAYFADKLDEQLDDQAKAFINDKRKNVITSDKINISKIFSWFKGDFTKEGSLISFLNKYSNTRISPNAGINHLDYDWNLNELE